MKRKLHSKTFWFIFKLILLLTLYFHHNVIAISTGISKGRKLIHFKSIHITSLNGNGLDADPSSGKSENIYGRSHRPARLLPLKYAL